MNNIYKELKKKLGGKTSLKLCNNTYLSEYRPMELAIRLHSTNILVFTPNDRVYVYTGGYYTPTTKKRINQYLPEGFRIFQMDFVWRWSPVGFLFSTGDFLECKKGKWRFGGNSFNASNKWGLTNSR